MPSRLHPRSRFTSSLFATTLFASFFVVVLPHALPCPAPRVAFADENGEMPPPGRRRRRRRECVGQEGEAEVAEAEKSWEPKTMTVTGGKQGGIQAGQVEEKGGDYTEERLRRSRIKRECPVPKPGGFVGEMLGFRAVRVREEISRRGSKPP